VSRASRKGYVAEAMVVAWLTARGYYVWRPRTTSRQRTDTGDVRGLPFVVSIKNHARIHLAEAVDEMADQVVRSRWRTGILVHKRVGRGRAEDWYVSLPLRLMGPFIDAYVAVTPLSVEPPDEPQSAHDEQADGDGDEEDGRHVADYAPADMRPSR
jgi:hypothetical protein